MLGWWRGMRLCWAGGGMGLCRACGEVGLG